jgi:hydroxyethylthiazole kinase
MLWDDVQRIRAEAPLVHNVTNYVVMNTTANALLAAGASPVMAHAVEEVEEMVGIARALVLNIGTLDAGWVASMTKAGLAASARGIPIVLDPVGAGATTYRTAVATRLLAEVRPTIVRGNASEIRALVLAERGTRGVDSAHDTAEAVEAGRELARRASCVVSISGAVDVITDGERVARVHNGVPLLARITGSGCTATALTGAFAAVGGSPFVAATHAMAFLGIAGEIAAERAAGPGTLQAYLFDALAGITREDVERRARIEGV